MASALESGSGSSGTNLVSVMRRLVWREPPVWTWWQGILPLLGLFLLGGYAYNSFARHEIEAHVLDQTRVALMAHDAAWAHVAVSGQEVTLSGIEPAPGAGALAMQVARDATCPTWIGRHTCAVEVKGAFGMPETGALPTAAAVCEKSLGDLVSKTPIEFATASAAISERSFPLLDQLAAAAAQCPGQVRVEGHTDSVGNAAYNEKLSRERARAVQNALTSRGFPAARISSEGFGASRPVADNATEEGRARNRRIEFHVMVDDRH